MFVKTNNISIYGFYLAKGHISLNYTKTQNRHLLLLSLYSVVIITQPEPITDRHHFTPPSAAAAAENLKENACGRFSFCCPGGSF